MAMLQLILGNIGVRGGGMNALRGHSNIQGLTDLGLMSNLIPGYLTLASDQEPTFDSYMSTRGFKPLRPGQTSYWQNYKKFFVSFQKAMWGDAATAENDFAYDWLPKLDVSGYDLLRAFQLMYEGKSTDVIDLYQVHWPDFETPIAETARTLEDLRHQGKIRASSRATGASAVCVGQDARSSSAARLEKQSRFFKVGHLKLAG
jgi:hypothetical protein